MAKNSTRQVKAELAELIQTEGVMAAYSAALAVCRDTAAPPSARATASATLFRVAGYFEKPSEDQTEKNPSEMTMAEMEEALRRNLSLIENDPDIFG